MFADCEVSNEGSPHLRWHLPVPQISTGSLLDTSAKTALYHTLENSKVQWSDGYTRLPHEPLPLQVDKQSPGQRLQPGGSYSITRQCTVTSTQQDWSAVHVQQFSVLHYTTPLLPGVFVYRGTTDPGDTDLSQPFSRDHSTLHTVQYHSVKTLHFKQVICWNNAIFTISLEYWVFLG